MKALLPEVAHSTIDELQPTLVASRPVHISPSAFEKMSRFINSSETLFAQNSFRDSLISDLEVQRFNPGYESLFTSYDFHVIQDHVKLIEINTNASMSSLFYLLEQQQEQRQFPDYLEDIRAMFNEVHAGGSVYIMDQRPNEQAMYFEFLLINAWLKQFGFSSTIIDSQEVHSLLQKDTNPTIYNRDTDFYLQSKNLEELRHSYLSNAAHVSPHPFGYFLRADKRRLALMRKFAKNDSSLNIDRSLMEEVIPESFDVDADSAELLWKNRAKYFFKPKNSFGSKAVYKGKTISKKVFEHILSEPYVAQVLCPPGECLQTTPSGEESFKFDIRVYTFGAKIFMMGARVYQGQVTNFRTLGGGAASVIVEALKSQN